MKENKQEIYESICEKLRKLKRLADQGYKGEAENARRLIASICRQYGIRPEDVFDAEKRRAYTIRVGANPDYKNLYFRCLSNVCDTTNMRYICRGSNSVEIELTAMEYAESVSMFEWHKRNLQEEFKRVKEEFYAAYLLHHDLRLESEREERDPSQRKPLTCEEIAQLRRIFQMGDNMSENRYHKMIAKAR
jgi:hypothetical protein